MSGYYIASTTGALTMSSREIAELTGKRHDNVVRDTRTMLVKLHGEGAVLKFEGSYTGQDNTVRPCFNLPFHETMTLMTGYDIPLRSRVIARWQELEAKQEASVPKSLPEALRLAADLAEKKERAEALLLETEKKVVALAPVAAVTEQIFNRGRYKRLSDVAALEISFIFQTTSPAMVPDLGLQTTRSSL